MSSSNDVAAATQRAPLGSFPSWLSAFLRRRRALTQASPAWRCPRSPRTWASPGRAFPRCQHRDTFPCSNRHRHRRPSRPNWRSTRDHDRTRSGGTGQPDRRRQPIAGRAIAWARCCWRRDGCTVRRCVLNGSSDRRKADHRISYWPMDWPALYLHDRLQHHRIRPHRNLLAGRVHPHPGRLSHHDVGSTEDAAGNASARFVGSTSSGFRHWAWAWCSSWSQ